MIQSIHLPPGFPCAWQFSGKLIPIRSKKEIKEYLPKNIKRFRNNGICKIISPKKFEIIFQGQKRLHFFKILKILIQFNGSFFHIVSEQPNIKVRVVITFSNFWHVSKISKQIVLLNHRVIFLKKRVHLPEAGTNDLFHLQTAQIWPILTNRRQTMHN